MLNANAELLEIALNNTVEMRICMHLQSLQRSINLNLGLACN
jgi:hypothetical protein